jgi:hypothetical protein
MLIFNTAICKTIAAFSLLISVTACVQEADHTDTEDKTSLSNTLPTQKHDINAAGVQFKQPSTQFKSLSDTEQHQ